MRRILAELTLCLLLGALINILVAWTCIHVSPRAKATLPAADTFIDHLVDLCWDQPLLRQTTRRNDLVGFGVHQVFVDTDHDIPLLGYTPVVGALVTAGPSPDVLTAVRAGWPMYSLQCSARAAAPDEVVKQSASWQWIGALPSADGSGPASYHRSTPLIYQPRAPGFLLNTFFYAVLVGLFLTTPRLRRARRRHRGRCPACNYDRRATPPRAPCPECGQT